MLERETSVAACRFGRAMALSPTAGMVLLAAVITLPGCSKAEPDDAASMADRDANGARAIAPPNFADQPSGIHEQADDVRDQPHVFHEQAESDRSSTEPAPTSLRSLSLPKPAPTPTTSGDAIASSSPAGTGFRPMAVQPLAVEPLAVEPMAMEAAASKPLPAEPMAIQSRQMAAAPEPATAAMPEHLRQMPAGTTHDDQQGYATVQVFYATDRESTAVPLSAYELTGQKQLVVLLSGIAVLSAMFSLLGFLRKRPGAAQLSSLIALTTAAAVGAIIHTGQANIEKHGVTYGGQRGQLTRGVAEVTVPDKHSRGVVERPSLLRFEFREDQAKHIVLTRAVELSDDDFQRRLADTVSDSPQQDLLVFIHGYNVSFESAVQRTAQIAIDLPFEGVPICYSWPSQGTLLGYTIDENNSAWTVAHLKSFLTDLVNESGAKSVNVVAHSMGNRAMTAALQQIRWSLPENSPPPFDRVVLAAPDVDADLFRRDLAPALVDVSRQVTLYASSDDQALIASKQVHGYPRAGESGDHIVVVPGVETIDVSGIDLSLLGHSYYGDSESMLRDLYNVIYSRLPAAERPALIQRPIDAGVYWQLARFGNATMMH